MYFQKAWDTVALRSKVKANLWEEEALITSVPASGPQQEGHKSVEQSFFPHWHVAPAFAHLH